MLLNYFVITYFAEDFRHKKFRNIEISSDEVVLKPIEQHEPEQKEIILSK